MIAEHNRRAAELLAASPALDDEALYQRARAWTIGILQRVTYNEYLPALLGVLPPPYAGYNPDVVVGIDAAAGVAALRYGHSAVGGVVIVLDEDFQPVLNGAFVPLSSTIFNISLIEAHGLLPLLRGLVTGRDDEVDTRITAQLRMGLAGKAPSFPAGYDLFAASIQVHSGVSLT
jgi:peroxidase